MEPCEEWHTQCKFLRHSLEASDIDAVAVAVAVAVQAESVWNEQSEFLRRSLNPTDVSAVAAVLQAERASRTASEKQTRSHKNDMEQRIPTAQ